jgi:multiple sugar transport system substrate-binding protein
MPHHSRRRSRLLSVLAVSAATVVALAACSSGSSGNSATSASPVTITYQTWVPNMQKAVNAFNTSHKDVQVKLQTITAGPNGGYAKMLSAVKAGNPGDVAQVGYDELPTFLLDGALTDITQYTKSDAAKFTDWQWQTGVFNNKVYGVPQASGPVGQFYRKDVFTKLGLKPPTTWDEYYADAVKIHKANPNAYIAAFASNQAPWIMALAQQAGTPWFTVSGSSWKVAIDNPDTLKMAAFWQKLLDQHLVKVEADMSDQWYKDIQTGDVASWMSGSWAGAIIEGNAPSTSGKWAVAEMPQWTPGAHVSASWGGGSSNVVLKGSKHPAQAAEFALWLNGTPSSQSTLNSIGAGWPSIKDTAQVATIKSDPTNQKFFGGQNVNDVFSVADQNIDLSWKWPPLVDTLYAKLVDNVQASIQNKTGYAGAFEQTQKDMVAAMKAKGISVTQ